MIPFIDEASDTEETGEEGGAIGKMYVQIPNCIVSLRRCVTRSTLHGKVCIKHERATEWPAVRIGIIYRDLETVRDCITHSQRRVCESRFSVRPSSMKMEISERQL